MRVSFDKWITKNASDPPWRIKQEERSNLVSTAIFVLASLLLLGLFLVPIANYYQTENINQEKAIAFDRADAQISRILQAAYLAHTDSILYLSLQETPSRPTCDSTRACLEESLTALSKEIERDKDIRASGPEPFSAWEQARELLQQWQALIFSSSPATADRSLEYTLSLSNALFSRVKNTLLNTQREIVTHEKQLLAATRGANETHMMRVFYLECACLSLITLSGWYMHRIRHLKDTNRKTVHLLDRANDAIDDRVRNMLQLINSLIEMQQGEAAPARQQAALENIASNIRAIAAVHSMQGAERIQDAIPVDVLLRRLTSRYEASPPLFQSKAKPSLLSVRKSTSLALIINELLRFARQRGVSLKSVELHREEEELTINLNFAHTLNMEPENANILMVNTLMRHDLSGAIQYRRDSPQISLCFPEDRQC